MIGGSLGHVVEDGVVGGAGASSKVSIGWLTATLAGEPAGVLGAAQQDESRAKVTSRRLTGNEPTPFVNGR